MMYVTGSMMHIRGVYGMHVRGGVYDVCNWIYDAYKVVSVMHVRGSLWCI